MRFWVNVYINRNAIFRILLPNPILLSALRNKNPNILLASKFSLTWYMQQTSDPNKITTQITRKLHTQSPRSLIIETREKPGINNSIFSIKFQNLKKALKSFTNMNNSRNSLKLFMRYSIFHIIFYDNLHTE